MCNDFSSQTLYESLVQYAEHSADCEYDTD